MAFHLIPLNYIYLSASSTATRGRRIDRSMVGWMDGGLESRPTIPSLQKNQHCEIFKITKGFLIAFSHAHRQSDLGDRDRDRLKEIWN